MRQSRFDERRKSVVSKPDQTKALEKSRMAEWTESTSITQTPRNNDSAYSLSLTTDLTVRGH